MSQKLIELPGEAEALPAPSLMECVQIKAPWRWLQSPEMLLWRENSISPKLWLIRLFDFPWSISPNSAPLGAAAHLSTIMTWGWGGENLRGLTASYYGFGLWFWGQSSLNLGNFTMRIFAFLSVLLLFSLLIWNTQLSQVKWRKVDFNSHFTWRF